MDLPGVHAPKSLKTMHDNLTMEQVNMVSPAAHTSLDDPVNYSFFTEEFEEILGKGSKSPITTPSSFGRASGATEDEPQPSSSTTSTDNPGAPMAQARCNSDRRRRRSKLVPDAKTRRKICADRAAIFGRIWSWSLSLVGMDRAKYSIDTSDSLVNQMCCELTNDDNAIQDIQGRGYVRVLQSRWHAMILAEEYEKETDLEHHHHCLLQSQYQHTKGKKPDDRGRRKNDKVLDKITSDFYGLDPNQKLPSEDEKRATVRRWIRIGCHMLELVKELGWAAMLVPGLLLSQEDLEKIGIHQTHELVKYIKDCYSGWVQELVDVSPIVLSLVCAGLPRGTILNIHTLPQGSASAIMDLPLSYWLSRAEVPNSLNGLEPLNLEPRGKAGCRNDTDQSRVVDNGYEQVDGCDLQSSGKLSVMPTKQLTDCTVGGGMVEGGRDDGSLKQQGRNEQQTYSSYVDPRGLEAGSTSLPPYWA